MPVAQDVEQLRQAAAGGDADALFRLGDLHERGEGVDRNLDLAAGYMRLAAERGHAEAQYRYGLYLAAGLGAEADLRSGYTWLALAAESDASIALVAAALRDQVAERLDPEALTAARERAAEFEPTSGPASLPEAAAAVAEAPLDPETLEARLPPTGCGRVRVAIEDGGAVTVSGHLPADTSLDAWRDDARAAVAEREVAFDLSPLDGSLCRVLDLLGDHPATLDDGPAVTLRDAEGEAKRTFKELDQLVIEIGPMTARRHVFVDYFVHDGDVLHMLPAADGVDNVVAEGASLTLGDPAADARTWEIGPPFGRDLVVVFATERPLYSGERGVVEPSGDYLEFLRSRLASPLPNDTIGATWRVITTEPR